MIIYNVVFNFYTRYVFQLLIRITLEKLTGMELSLANVYIEPSFHLVDIFQQLYSPYFCTNEKK